MTIVHFLLLKSLTSLQTLPLCKNTYGMIDIKSIAEWQIICINTFYAVSNVVHIFVGRVHACVYYHILENYNQLFSFTHCQKISLKGTFL